jgi:hypothetical protein
MIEGNRRKDRGESSSQDATMFNSHTQSQILVYEGQTCHAKEKEKEEEKKQRESYKLHHASVRIPPTVIKLKHLGQ